MCKSQNVRGNLVKVKILGVYSIYIYVSFAYVTVPWLHITLYYCLQIMLFSIHSAYFRMQSLHFNDITETTFYFQRELSNDYSQVCYVLNTYILFTSGIFYNDKS